VLASGERGQLPPTARFSRRRWEGKKEFQVLRGMWPENRTAGSVYYVPAIAPDRSRRTHMFSDSFVTALASIVFV
jgi:hypothetical protein